MLNVFGMVFAESQPSGQSGFFKEGLVVEYHICGSARKLIPGLIDAGVDILNPVQPNATGMAPAELKNLYGKDIAISGGVNVQTTLPYGSVQQVRDEAKFLLQTLGSDGGYIFGPSHAVQVGTPPENIVAKMDAAYSYYGMELPLSGSSLLRELHL